MRRGDIVYVKHTMHKGVLIREARDCWYVLFNSSITGQVGEATILFPGMIVGLVKATDLEPAPNPGD